MHTDKHFISLTWPSCLANVNKLVKFLFDLLFCMWHLWIFFIGKYDFTFNKHKDLIYIPFLPLWRVHQVTILVYVRYHRGNLQGINTKVINFQKVFSTLSLTKGKSQYLPTLKLYNFVLFLRLHPRQTQKRMQVKNETPMLFYMSTRQATRKTKQSPHRIKYLASNIQYHNLHGAHRMWQVVYSLCVSFATTQHNIMSETHCSQYYCLMPQYLLQKKHRYARK